MCLRLNFNIYSLPAHELLSLLLSRSLIASLDWFAWNSCSFSSLATSSNSIGKYILHAPLTSLVAALNSFTHSTRLRFWGSGSLVESKWCHYVMVEADSHLKLLTPSILDIYKWNWIHWYAVHRHMVAALHSNPPYLAQILGFGVTYGVEMMSLHHGWGWQPPKKMLPAFILDIYKVFEHIDMLSVGIG